MEFLREGLASNRREAESFPLWSTVNSIELPSPSRAAGRIRHPLGRAPLKIGNSDNIAAVAVSEPSGISATT